MARFGIFGVEDAMAASANDRFGPARTKRSVMARARTSGNSAPSLAGFWRGGAPESGGVSPRPSPALETTQIFHFSDRRIPQIHRDTEPVSGFAVIERGEFFRIPFRRFDEG